MRARMTRLAAALAALAALAIGAALAAAPGSDRTSANAPGPADHERDDEEEQPSYRSSIRDERFRRWLHAEATATGVDVFSIVTTAGGTVFLAALTTIGALFFLRRDKLDGAYLAAAFLGAQAVNVALKLAFARARPELDHPFVNLHSYSFPSAVTPPFPWPCTARSPSCSRAERHRGARAR